MTTTEPSSTSTAPANTTVDLTGFPIRRYNRTALKGIHDTVKVCAFCRTATTGGNVPVMDSPNSPTAWVGSLMFCDNDWLCDFCAWSQCLAERTRLLWWQKQHLAAGGRLFHAVFAIRHHFDDDLVRRTDTAGRPIVYSCDEGWTGDMIDRLPLREVLMDTWAKLNLVSGPIRRGGYEKWHRAIQVTFSFRNSFHPHFHVTFFVDGDADLDHFRRHVGGGWLKRLGRYDRAPESVWVEEIRDPAANAAYVTSEDPDPDGPSGGPDDADQLVEYDEPRFGDDGDDAVWDDNGYAGPGWYDGDDNYLGEHLLTDTAAVTGSVDEPWELQPKKRRPHNWETRRYSPFQIARQAAPAGEYGEDPTFAGVWRQYAEGVKGWQRFTPSKALTAAYGEPPIEPRDYGRQIGWIQGELHNLLMRWRMPNGRDLQVIVMRVLKAKGWRAAASVATRCLSTNYRGRAVVVAYINTGPDPNNRQPVLRLADGLPDADNLNRRALEATLK